MRIQDLGLAVALAFVTCFGAALRPAAAATADINLQCFDPVGAEYIRYSETDSSPNLVVWGGLFDAAADQEMHCQFTVPTDYEDASTTEPSVRLVGYARDCVGCLLSACDTTRKVKFKIASKALQPGYGIFLSWGTEASDEESYTSVSCGGSCVTSTCYQDDQVRSFTADATDDASYWMPGDTVLIRILRDTSVANNLASDFLVTGFRLTYPLD